jgi:hypothetical protein
MSLINDVKEVLHRIRVKLYPNYLPNAEGAYIARTDSEASLSIEDVCASLKNRGGFTGNYDDLTDHIKQYFDEMAYQLCDGFAVNTGYYSVHPNIGGTFNNERETHDHSKHPVSFRFRTLQKLRKLANNIAVEIEGIADTQGYIAEFLDVSTGAVNESFTNGGQFVIAGYKIKISGDNPDCGVYFENGKFQLKVSENLAENTASKLIGVIPACPPGTYKVVVKTQFSGSTNTPLKNPRFIESGFELTIA